MGKPDETAKQRERMDGIRMIEAEKILVLIEINGSFQTAVQHGQHSLQDLGDIKNFFGSENRK